MNLKNHLPEKFDDLVRRWNTATEDEVFPLYMPDEREALEVSVSQLSWQTSRRRKLWILRLRYYCASSPCVSVFIQ